MSTLNLENIKHPDSASNNISVDSSGRTIVNGNMGIGTSSPTSLLHVQNTSGANIGIQATSGGHWRIGDGVGSTNGNLVIYDYGNSAKRMEIDSAGRVTMPYQPAFYANSSAGGQNSGTTEVQFNSNSGQSFNDGNHYSYSTYRFTAPVAGKYLFTTSLYTNNGTNFQVRMAVNGSYANTAGPLNQDLAQPYGDHGYITKTLTVILKLNANDYVSVLYASGNQVYTDADTHFSGILLG